MIRAGKLFLFVGFAIEFSQGSIVLGQSSDECRSGGFYACDNCYCGPCDNPVQRDAWDLDTFSQRDPMVIKIRFVILGNTADTEDAATPQQVNDQLGRLNVVFEDYGITLVRGMNDTFVNSDLHYNFCTGSDDCFCLPECIGDCMFDSSIPPYREGIKAYEGRLKYDLSVDPDEMLNIFVTDMQSAEGFKGLGHGPWCSYASSYLNGIIIDKAYFGGQICGSSHDAWCDLLVHEVGHNLGLWHTFHPNICNCESYQCDGTCDPEHPECDVGGDNCCDTPVSVPGSLLTCQDYTEGAEDSCSEYQHGPADYTNYMDYAEDGC